MKNLANVLTGHPYQNKKTIKMMVNSGTHWNRHYAGIMPDIILMLQAFLRNVKDFFLQQIPTHK